MCLFITKDRVDWSWFAFTAVTRFVFYIILSDKYNLKNILNFWTSSFFHKFFNNQDKKICSVFYYDSRVQQNVFRKTALRRNTCIYIYIRFAHSAKHEWRWRVSNFFLNFWTWTLNIYSCCWWRFHVVHMFWVHVHNSQDFHCTVKSYMLYSMHWGGEGGGERDRYHTICFLCEIYCWNNRVLAHYQHKYFLLEAFKNSFVLHFTGSGDVRKWHFSLLKYRYMDQSSFPIKLNAFLVLLL